MFYKNNQKQCDIQQSLILQGLRVTQVAMTERWPQKVGKNVKKIGVFFRKKIIITQRIFF